MASSKYGHQNSITKHPENREKRRVNRKIKRLRAEMGEISKQHESIRQGQKEMRERFVEIESECDQLKKETQIISHASDNVQLRLNIIFKILKAREEKDFRKAADLTSSLRLVFKTPSRIQGFICFAKNIPPF
ncbi:hypothetical protein DKX38_000544 [Salix brachista]|uniref:Uncharacterized protein n=1 Tax=Salix brachista TaxID=2182728 RepID=A0A5N5P0S2_9ROSI|nr:hypothetical protein DKX38_000544 [Salix brachista]